MKFFPLTAGALGAGLMYFFDPDRGRHRRAQVADKSVHMTRKTREAAVAAAHDLRNRTNGVLADAASLLRRDDATDTVLVKRVSARLGHATPHARAIEVTATDGTVSICGPVLAAEAERVRAAVSSTRGVRQVDDRLELHETADVPGLGDPSSSEDGEGAAKRRSLPPAARLLAGVAGGAAAVYGLRRRGAVGAAAGTLGLGAVAGMFLTTRPAAQKHEHEQEHELPE